MMSGQPRREPGGSEPRSILALIPARSGSKGIPNKNIRPFRGLPLMAHSIRHALASALVTRTIVSTDSREYADLARQHGGEVPFLRPTELAGDSSTDLEVFEHALDWLEREEGYRPEICVHLRPTYPSRRVADIDAMVQILLDSPELDSARSVAPAPATPFKIWFRDSSGLLTPAVPSGIRDAHSAPRQGLPEAFLQNACIDVVRTKVIRERHSMTGDRIFGYLMDEQEDIDDELEFQRVQVAEELRAGAPGTGSFRRRVVCVDIDGVLATIVPSDRYDQAEPIRAAIDAVNRIHDAGHEIVLFTARGSATGLEWRELTERQMRTWKVRYDRLMFGKPAADVYVDDRSLLPADLTALVNRLAGE